MKLHGSCHCQSVKFEVESSQPVPYQYCYCSICRKTSGGGGYLINLGADANTLKVEGQEHVEVYCAMLDRGQGKVKSSHQRHFCKRCGSHLWAFHPKWPELLHPVASAIDTDLPQAPELVHMMLGSRANWVVPKAGEHDRCFDEYPELSLADWHKKQGLEL